MQSEIKTKLPWCKQLNTVHHFMYIYRHITQTSSHKTFEKVSRLYFLMTEKLKGVKATNTSACLSLMKPKWKGWCLLANVTVNSPQRPSLLRFHGDSEWSEQHLINNIHFNNNSSYWTQDNVKDNWTSLNKKNNFQNFHYVKNWCEIRRIRLNLLTKRGIGTFQKKQKVLEM